MKTIDLKDKIISDYFSSKKVTEGMKLPVVKELAAQYGVSTPTIGKTVALLEAEGWITKRRGSGLYFTGNNPVKKGKEKKIGCIVPNFYFSVAYKMAMGVEAVSKYHGHLLDIVNSNADYEEECRQVESMINRGVKGIVLYPTPNRSNKQNEFLAEKFLDFPIVIADLYKPEMKRPHVVFDNFDACCEMTEFLIGKQCRNIGFLTFENASFSSLDQRLKGYRRAMWRTGNLKEQIITCPLEESKPENIDKLTERILAESPELDALILPNDFYADNLIKNLHKDKFKSRREMLICGFDNTQKIGDGLIYPTTGPDFFKMGERATEELFEMIEDGNCQKDSEILLPCPLMIPNANGENLKTPSHKSLNDNIFSCGKAVEA